MLVKQYPWTLRLPVATEQSPVLWRSCTNRKFLALRFSSNTQIYSKASQSFILPVSRKMSLSLISKNLLMYQRFTHTGHLQRWSQEGKSFSSTVKTRAKRQPWLCWINLSSIQAPLTQLWPICSWMRITGEWTCQETWWERRRKLPERPGKRKLYVLVFH